MSIFTMPPRQNIKRGCKSFASHHLLSPQLPPAGDGGMGSFWAMASIPEHRPTTTAWGSINRAKSRRKTLAEMQTQHRGATPAPRLPRELPCPDLHAERSWCCGLSFAKVRGNDGDPEHQLRPPRRNLRTSKHTGRASTGQVRGACLAYSHLLG